MELYRKALALVDAGTPFAFSAVIHSTGSTPQKAGAKALFEAAGAVHGTLGGGCLEAEARRRALHSLDTDHAIAYDLRLDSIEGWDDGLVCGGKVRLFSDPAPARNAAAWRTMLNAADRGAAGLLLTVIQHPDHTPGDAHWIRADDFAAGALGLDAAQLDAVLRGERAASILQKDTEIFAEPVAPPPRLIVAGAGHIGKAVTALAAQVGFAVTVIDDRPLFANTANLPGATRVICGDIAGELAAIPKDARSYIVIVTRGHRHDGDALAACVGAEAAFIGMIGSRRKSLLIRREIVARGLATQEAVDRVVSPIGLDLGARTVDEIALSIVAQLTGLRRQGRLAAGSLAIPATGEASPGPVVDV